MLPFLRRAPWIPASAGMTGACGWVASKPRHPTARRGRGNLVHVMHFLGRFFAAIHGLIALLFAGAAIALVMIAVSLASGALAGGLSPETAQTVIEALGLLAAAVVALQISQTITEEEIVRGVDISAPTRVRRFSSRFLVVVVVALAIEGLVATFKAIREDLSQLVYAAALVGATGLLLSAWGIFIHLNRSAEELEPEAMEKAKREDRKLE